MLSIRNLRALSTASSSSSSSSISMLKMRCRLYPISRRSAQITIIGTNAFVNGRCFSNSHISYEDKHKHENDLTNGNHHGHPPKPHSHPHTPHSHPHSHSLFGHSHSHTHSVEENVFLQEKGGLSNPAIRITWIGLAVNVGMAIGKGVGGVVFHSQALLADSVHAMSDLVSDFLTLATVSIGSRPVSKYFPNGYGKVETLGSLGVSGLLVVAGMSMGWDGLLTMTQHWFGDIPWLDLLRGHGHSHSHSTSAGSSGGVEPFEAASLNAAWLALGSIAVKEWLYRATLKVGKKTGSPVLVANAWHHRVDSMVSVVAVATIGGGYFLGINWLDPLGGLLVSSIIVRAGFSSARSAVLELVDNNSVMMKGGADGDISKLETHRERINEFLEEQQMTINNYVLSKLEIMPSGPNYTSYIELLPSSPSFSSSSLEEFQQTAEALRQELMAHDKGLKRVIISVGKKQ